MLNRTKNFQSHTRVTQYSPNWANCPRPQELLGKSFPKHSKYGQNSGCVRCRRSERLCSLNLKAGSCEYDPVSGNGSEVLLITLHELYHLNFSSLGPSAHRRRCVFLFVQAARHVKNCLGFFSISMSGILCLCTATIISQQNYT